jgi:hypothetical protein
VRSVFRSDCGVEQLVARQAHNLEADGSSPSPTTVLWKGLLMVGCGSVLQPTFYGLVSKRNGGGGDPAASTAVHGSRQYHDANGDASIGGLIPP